MLSSHTDSVSSRKRPLEELLMGDRSVGVVLVIPLLVEYSEDDDTGCAFGTIAMIGVIVGSLLLLRLATIRNRR
jgi:hypothetical protein